MASLVGDAVGATDGSFSAVGEPVVGAAGDSVGELVSTSQAATYVLSLLQYKGPLPQYPMTDLHHVPSPSSHGSPEQCTSYTKTKVGAAVVGSADG